MDCRVVAWILSTTISETIPEVSTTYAYVDHRQTVSKKFSQADREDLVKHFDSEYDKVNSDKDFKPTVNEFCKWCPATRAMCPYSRKI